MASTDKCSNSCGTPLWMPAIFLMVRTCPTLYKTSSGLRSEDRSLRTRPFGSSTIKDFARGKDKLLSPQFPGRVFEMETFAEPLDLFTTRQGTMSQPTLGNLSQ